MQRPRGVPAEPWEGTAECVQPLSSYPGPDADPSLTLTLTRARTPPQPEPPFPQALLSYAFVRSNPWHDPAAEAAAPVIQETAKQLAPIAKEAADVVAPVLVEGAKTVGSKAFEFALIGGDALIKFGGEADRFINADGGIDFEALREFLQQQRVNVDRLRSLELGPATIIDIET